MGESVGEEDNREVKDDPLNSSSPEGQVKDENENPEGRVLLPYCFPPLLTPHLRARTPDSHLQILPVPPDRPPIP